jgi:hypothetical protein
MRSEAAITSGDINPINTYVLIMLESSCFRKVRVYRLHGAIAMPEIKPLQYEQYLRQIFRILFISLGAANHMPSPALYLNKYNHMI